MLLAKLGKGMLSSVEQVFVGKDERRAPLKTPAWEASTNSYFPEYFSGFLFAAGKVASST